MTTSISNTMRYIRCTGAEYIAFFSDDSFWPEGRFMDQMINRIDGDWMADTLRMAQIHPDAAIEISDQGGVLDDSPTFAYVNIIAYFNNWKQTKMLPAAIPFEADY